ncbi:MAG TPA: hypothetical protein VKU85_14260 [bacterium]|nr:hypothetical protein [bacterium]
MRPSPLFVFLGFLLAATSTVPARASTFSEYVVTLRDPEASTIHVRASFVPQSEMIGMFITASDDLPNGQADLVRDLTIRSESGDDVPFETIPGGDWRLSGVEPGSRIVADYDIALEHQRHHWGPGIDEVAYRNEDGLFFTGFTLFLMPGTADVDASIRFELPPGWRASTPWERSGRGFVSRGFSSLGRNCLFLGTHREESVTLGEYTFLIAAGGALKDDTEQFVEVMRAVIPAYERTFAGPPNATRYLMVINAGERADGGAFDGSYSMLIKGRVNEASRAVWGHGIAHEILHFWNGHTLVPESRSEEEWFKEGLTDYLTTTHLSRSGVDPPDVTLRKLEHFVMRYTTARHVQRLEESLRDAGAHKHRMHTLVYGGGSLVAFALDVRLRAATGNRRGLDDLMAAMYAEFGRTGVPYRYDDILRTAGEISGEDQADFFARFVAGTEFLDATPYFESAGLQLDSFLDIAYLAPDETAPESARAVREAILGKLDR